MQPFATHTGLVAPLDRVNVDTDQMVPKQFLKALTREGFGRILFYDWRYLPGEKPNPEFVLNFPRYKGASVLLARANFGCGSSREHAPSGKEVWVKGRGALGPWMQQAAAIAACEKAHASTATMYDPVDVKYYSNGR